MMLSSLQKISSLIKNTLEIVQETAAKENLLQAYNLMIPMVDKIFVLYEEKAKLTKVKDELEGKLTEYKKWDVIAEQYELAELASGIFAYVSKPDTNRACPRHYLCQNCFHKKKKSILQRSKFDPSGTFYQCFECGAEICDHFDRKEVKPRSGKRRSGMAV